MVNIKDLRKELCEKYGEQLQSVMDVVGNWAETGEEVLGSLLLNIIEEADLLRNGAYETFLENTKALTSVKALMGLYHDDPKVLGKLGAIYWKLEDIRSELAIKLGVKEPQTYIR